MNSYLMRLWSLRLLRGLVLGGVFSMLMVSSVAGCGGGSEKSVSGDAGGDGGAAGIELDLASIEEARIQARNDVNTLIATPTCKADTDCRAIAFGEKPCGGPWEYKVYSTDVTDSTTLEVAVGEYNYYDRLYNERTEAVSDCMLAAEPQVGCVSGVCQAVS